ncbi:MAG: FAD-dependent oxidoreductase [Gammaproteobacteria bacterium]|nr:FAD-dependent oxidoreductase [Gammaproteobacteria bacterium]
MNSTRIIVAGGGFAGLWAAVAAARAFSVRGTKGASVTLVSRDPYLTVRPRLYEANPREMHIPLPPMLNLAGVLFREADIVAVHPSLRRIALGDDCEIAYDRLILATGSELRPLPAPGIKEHSFNIDTYAAALALDEHLTGLGRTSAASGSDTLVIIGAGFTGVELATEIRSRLVVLWGRERAAAGRVILVEIADVIGPDLGANPRPHIEAALRAQGVDVRLGARVTRVEPGAVWLGNGERIETRTTIVTAGLRASGLAQVMSEATLDKLGRLHVDSMLRVKGVTHLYAAGDIAHAHVDGEHVAPMSCQHAILMGKVAGHNAARDLLGLTPLPYRQPDYVTCLDLGPKDALFTEGWERQVRHTGVEGKNLKRLINTEWIYPPQSDRAALFEAVRIDLRRSDIDD